MLLQQNAPTASPLNTHSNYISAGSTDAIWRSHLHAARSGAGVVMPDGEVVTFEDGMPADWAVSNWPIWEIQRPAFAGLFILS